MAGHRPKPGDHVRHETWESDVPDAVVEDIIKVGEYLHVKWKKRGGSINPSIPIRDFSAAYGWEIIKRKKDEPGPRTKPGTAA